MSQVKRQLRKAAVAKDGQKGTERAYARCRKLRESLIGKMKDSPSDSSVG